MGAFLRCQYGKRGGQRARISRGPRNDSGADDVIRGHAGSGIDYMRIVPATDLHASPIIAAGRNSAIANKETRDGSAFFYVGPRSEKVTRFAPFALDHEIAADVDDKSPRA